MKQWHRCPIDGYEYASIGGPKQCPNPTCGALLPQCRLDALARKVIEENRRRAALRIGGKRHGN